MSHSPNPLLSTSPLAWDRLLEAIEPASLLLVIEQRMSTALRNVLTAEDILQEALLHAWRDRRKFDWRGLRSFRSWLLSIIDHRISDAADQNGAAKRSGGEPSITLSALGDGADSATSAERDFPRGSTTPSKLAMYREQAGAMRLALDSLPDELRDVVRLRLFEQCPLESIAAQLSIGLAAVRHRFRKGSELYLKRLRGALGSSSPSMAPEFTADPPPESSPPEGSAPIVP